MPLYIVATPIGNLDDMTFRAVSTLKKCHFILAEDTRHTGNLLAKYEIKGTLVSYRDQNHERMIEKALEKLRDGLSLALVSDAGTPCISDPGYKLVRDVRAAGYDVIPVPGASAVTAMLSVCGLPTDKFLFLGFLPKANSPREKTLADAINIDASVVLYESPNRLLELLRLVKKLDATRLVSVGNDLTKIYEDVQTGGVEDILVHFQGLEKAGKIRGEYVVVIAKKGIVK